MADVEAALDRQQQIWAGMYGPSRAGELIDEARARLAQDGEADVASILRSIDDGLHADDDLDEAGTMRPI